MKIGDMLMAASNFKFDPNQYKNEDCCSICLEDFKQEENVICLPCNRQHIFHSDCIVPWVRQNNNCPLCKAEITPQAIEMAQKNSDTNRNNDPNLRSGKSNAF